MNEKMDLTFYFLRHGQTALSREDVFCGSGLDPELTPEGSEMAEAFVNDSPASVRCPGNQSRSAR